MNRKELYEVIVLELKKLKVTVIEEDNELCWFRPIFNGIEWVGLININCIDDGNGDKLTKLSHEAVHALQHMLSSNTLIPILLGYKTTEGLLNYVNNFKKSPEWLKADYRKCREFELEAFSLELQPNLLLNILHLLNS